MPTDDERREVARRLRELEVCELDGEFIDCGEVESVLGLVSDDGAWYEADGVMRLADLIEPEDEPYNLFSLYEAVFHQTPRDGFVIEDDEVEELVDALMDMCNAPGHEHIARAGESGVIDRDALLALADEIHELVENQEIRFFHVVQVHESTLATIERRIREALGEGES